MPITIAPISAQNITINTAYSLPVSIGDNPDTVEVTGLLEGFYYSYANGTLMITGEATRLIGNAMWTVTAKKGTETVTSEIIYSVVPPAPIISTVPKQFITRGTPFSLDIPIENNPGNVTVTGHIIGLKSEGSNPLNISGTVPFSAEFTVNSGQFVITATNGGGSHTRNVDWEFARSLFAVDTNDDKVYVFSIQTPDGQTAQALRIFDLPSGLNIPTGAAVDGNDIYIYDNSGDEVFVIPADTLDMGTATASRRFPISGDSGTPGGLTVDENYIYILNGNGDVLVFDKQTPDSQNNQEVAPLRTFSAVDSALLIEGLAHDGTNLYTAYYDNDNASYIDVYPKNTPDGGTATRLRRFTTPNNAFIRAIVIHDDDIYAIDLGNRIQVFPKDTTDDTQAVASRSFNLPSDANNVQGLGIA